MPRIRSSVQGQSGRGSGRTGARVQNQPGGGGSVNASAQGKSGSGSVDSRRLSQQGGSGSIATDVDHGSGAPHPDSPQKGAVPVSAVSSLLGETRSGTKATLITGTANARVTWTSKLAGTGGNSVRIRFVNPGGTAARSITVSTLDVTVNLAVTAGVIDSTETANSIVAAINAHAGASAVLSAAATPGDGTSVVAAFAFTNLAGGLRVIEVGEGISPGPHPTEAYGGM